MERSSAILEDILNFLPAIESRLMSRQINFSDMLQVANLKQCFDILDNMLIQCESTLLMDDLDNLKKRIQCAKETAEIMKSGSDVLSITSIYGDVHILNGILDSKAKSVTEDYRFYGKHLNMNNEEFDLLVLEWADDKLNNDLNGYKRKSKSASTDLSFTKQDRIRGELAQLANTMKSKALWYRDVLVKDNEALTKYTSEHEKQLDNLTMVTQGASKLSRATSLSVYQSIMMILTMFILMFSMMFLFIIT